MKKSPIPEVVWPHATTKNQPIRSFAGGRNKKLGQSVGKGKVFDYDMKWRGSQFESMRNKIAEEVQNASR